MFDPGHAFNQKRHSVSAGAKEVAITVAATIAAADHFLKPCQLVVKITTHTPTHKKNILSYYSYVANTINLIQTTQ